jgi:hypothetical protein
MFFALRLRRHRPTSKLDGFVKSPSAALRLSASRLRSKALTCLLGFTAFGRKSKPPASQVAVYASFVIATYDKYASFLNIRAPCIWSFLLCRLFVDFLRVHQS